MSKGRKHQELDDAEIPAPLRSRDRKGRFVDSKGRVKIRHGRSRIGRRGTTSDVEKTHLQLARTVARLILSRDRLALELESHGVPAPDKPIRQKRNMEGCRRYQDGKSAEKIDALKRVLDVLACKSVDVTPTIITEMMNAELGYAFYIGELYRKPLDTMWQERADWLGADPEIDNTQAMRQCMRMSRGVLVSEKQRLTASIKDMTTQVHALLAKDRGTDDADWTPWGCP